VHKIFAKSLFLGKKVIFLPQCHSTNDQLAEMARIEKLPEGTVLYTDHQENGKGMRGNKWDAEKGKNVLLSLLISPKGLLIRDQFYLNLIISLAVSDTLKEVLVNSAVFIKWPNDIYVEKKKISGILIENSLKGNAIDSSIIGIGINLNQKKYDLPNATSLALELGDDTEREYFIERLLISIEKWYLKLNNGDKISILNAYYESLMWKDELHEFQTEGNLFKGIIIGIDESGRLVIESENGKTYTFNVKEVSFIS